MHNRYFTIMNRALHIPLFVLLILILHGCNLYGRRGFSREGSVLGQE